MFGLFKKTETLNAPISGNVFEITEVKDEVFSAKMMGDGFAIQPTDSNVYAPCDCEITQAFKTKHAVLIKTKNDLEILIHIGLDTVELKGEGFTMHVNDGDKVSAGDLLVSVDFDYIKNQGKGTDVMLILMNQDKWKDFKVTYGQTQSNNPICKVNLK